MFSPSWACVRASANALLILGPWVCTELGHGPVSSWVLTISKSLGYLTLSSPRSNPQAAKNSSVVALLILPSPQAWYRAWYCSTSLLKSAVSVIVLSFVVGGWAHFSYAWFGVIVCVLVSPKIGLLLPQPRAAKRQLRGKVGPVERSGTLHGHPKLNSSSVPSQLSGKKTDTSWWGFSPLRSSIVNFFFLSFIMVNFTAGWLISRFDMTKIQPFVTPCKYFNTFFQKKSQRKLMRWLVTWF